MSAKNTGSANNTGSAKNTRILIVAGGTGGHVFPGLAVANALRDRGHEVLWLGTQKGIESRLVPAANIPLYFSEISGVRGKGVFALVAAPFRIYKAIQAAKRQLKELRPSLVLGMGGFVAGPGGMAARSLKIPLVVHEQNAIAGTTNKILARFAKKRLSAFEGALKKSEYVGNPVREELENLAPPEERFADRDAAPRVLVLGGSRGAQALNELVPAAVGKSSFRDQALVWHQCGANRTQSVDEAYAAFGIQHKVDDFIDDVGQALAWADLVICRSGALTVAELSAVGVGSVLIPFPFAIDDHQTANAKFLETNGAALIRQQNELSPEILAVLLNELLANRSRLLEMARAARAVAKYQVAKKIADICESLLPATTTGGQVA